MQKIKIPPIYKNTNLRIVISLTAGDWGVSGMSGNSISSGSSCWGGAPRAAEGGLQRALSRGVSTGRTRLEAFLGGLYGLGAAAGVLGVEVLKVFTIIASGVFEAPGADQLPTVVMTGGLCPSRRSLVAKSSRQEIASMSTAASSSPSLPILALTFLMKGDFEWARTTPLDPPEDEDSPLLTPKPLSSEGGAEGSGYRPEEFLGVTRKNKNYK